MNTHYRDTRKIDPTRGATLADGSPNDQDRVEIGPRRHRHRPAPGGGEQQERPQRRGGGRAGQGILAGGRPAAQRRIQAERVAGGGDRLP